MKVTLKLKRGKKPPTNSASKGLLEKTFEAHLLAKGLGGKFSKQTTFIPGRRYKGDFVFNNVPLVVEVDGGDWLGARGGHTSGTGYNSDRVRDYLALMSGWLTLRLTGTQVKSKAGEGFQMFDEIYQRLIDGRITFEA
jgi:very-short-patch-repair endonuclease